MKGWWSWELRRLMGLAGSVDLASVAAVLLISKL